MLVFLSVNVNSEWEFQVLMNESTHRGLKSSMWWDTYAHKKSSEWVTFSTFSTALECFIAIRMGYDLQGFNQIIKCVEK